MFGIKLSASSGKIASLTRRVAGEMRRRDETVSHNIYYLASGRQPYRLCISSVIFVQDMSRIRKIRGAGGAAMARARALKVKNQT